MVSKASLSFSQRYGPWALVTGAALGLGAEFALQLGQRGLNLVLVDILPEALQDTAAHIRQQYPVQVRTVAADLAQENFMQQVRPALEGIEIGLLVNNAGISNVGEFLDVALEDHLRVLGVNTRAVLTLSHEIGPQLVQRGKGGILIVSSFAGMQGSALVGIYAATKAFDLTLAETLWDELRPAGVDVLGLVVGSAETPGFREAQPRASAGKSVVMQPEQVVSEALNALGKHMMYAPGWRNRLNLFLMRHFLSRQAATVMVGREMRVLYPHIQKR